MEDQIREGKIEVLKQYMKHKSPIVRTHVFTLITNFAFTNDLGPYYKDGLNDENSTVRNSVIKSIAKLHYPAHKEAYRYEYDERGIGTPIRTESKKLDIFNDKYMPIIFEALKDIDSKNQRDAIDLLVEIGDPRAVGHIIKLYKSEDETTREYASTGLNDKSYGWGEDKEEAIPPLLEALRDSDVRVRLGAIEYLPITGAKGIKHIVKVLTDKNPEIRKKACISLARTGDVLYLQDLIKMSKDPEKEVREQVNTCIGILLHVEWRT
ncbi:HEAT repeat domain-containing protein [bacterium]|nr:HEAT repeat domain-containing protein [bacterium]